MKTSATLVDPITIEVITSRFREIAATMEHLLYHSGYSTILRESKDGTAGLTDAAGRVVIVGGGMQYHTLSYECAVGSVLARYRDTMAPGDSFIVNDPFLGGNPHVPDMVALTPAFIAGRLIGFGVSIAHKADVGGIVPGSSGAAAREIYHDGLLLPPLRFQRGERIDEAVDAIIRNNSRAPDVVLGDIRGQVGCTRVGIRRLAELCAEYDVDTVVSTMREIIERTARRMREQIALLPDGRAEAEGYLDHDGADMEHRLCIRLAVEKRGDRLLLDFTGTSPQAAGPVNMVAVTARASALVALVAATDPTLPINSGLGDAVDLVLPEGTIVNARRPATVNQYVAPMGVLHDCVLAAIGTLDPRRAVAPGGLGLGAIAIGYRNGRSGKPSVQYEVLITGLGGTSTHDGASIVSPIGNMSASASIEVLEGEYPIRVRRFDVRCDSGGAGTFRGGLGFAREYELLADCIATSRTANHVNTAWGIVGGASAPSPAAILNPGRDDRVNLPPLFTRNLVTGDVFRVEQSGGGGYGPPSARDRTLVLADVRNGYVSREAAAEIYGVTT